MNGNVIILGLVSLFTDISSEMIYPLIPIYLTVVLGASPAVLGLIEGIAESLASLLKIFSGRISDRVNKRRPLAIAGYGFSAIGKVLFVVASSWPGILWARVSDRFGKGVRTAPRDALIVESCDSANRGKAFGLHRAMDTAGAVVGIVGAYWLFTNYQGNYHFVFWLSVIPAVLGVLLLFFVKEVKKGKQDAAKKLAFSWKFLDSRLKYFIIVSFLFNLGNSSNQFLLLKAGHFGFSAAQVILLYLCMNLTYMLIAYPAGRLSDRIGRRAILVSGYLLYGFVYIGFAVAKSSWAYIGLFAIYGLYTGMTEGIEKALLADLAPEKQKASVYGLHAFACGVAFFPASVLAGLLWSWLGSAAPFWFGGFTGIAAAIALFLGLQSVKPIRL
jgi:MFS family permease